MPGVVVMTPVAELYEMTEAPLREVEETLLLKTVQSAEARHPKTEAVAVSQSMSFTVRVSPSPAVIIFS